MRVGEIWTGKVEPTIVQMRGHVKILEIQNLNVKSVKFIFLNNEIVGSLPFEIFVKSFKKVYVDESGRDLGITGR